MILPIAFDTDIRAIFARVDEAAAIRDLMSAEPVPTSMARHVQRTTKLKPAIASPEIADRVHG